MLDIAFQNDNHLPPPPPSLHEITENTINDNSIKLNYLFTENYLPVKTSHLSFLPF